MNNNVLNSSDWSRRKVLTAFGLGAVAAAGVPLMAGCSTSSSTTGTSGGAKGQIKIGSFQDTAMKPFRDTYVQQFQAETGIKVIYEETSYDAWYQAAKSDGLNKTGAYDIYVMDDNWVPEFAAGEIIQSLDKLGLKVNPTIIKRGLEQGYWPPVAGPRLKAFKDAKPELFALVIIDDVNLFYYNKKYFDVAPQTWDDLDKVIKAKSAPPELFGYSVRGVKGNPAVMGFLPFLNSYGANFVNEDWTPGLASPEGIASLTRLLGWMPYLSQATPEFDTDQETGLMLQGKAMALTEYTGTAVAIMDDPTKSKVVGEIDIAAPLKQTKSGGAIGTFICGIAAGAKNTPAAVQFLEWFTSDKIQTQFARQGGNAAVTSTALSDPTAVAKYRWLPAIAQSVATSTPKPRTPDEPKFEDILGTQLNLAYIAALQQKGNYEQIARTALTTSSEQIKAVIQQNKAIYF